MTAAMPAEDDLLLEELRRRVRADGAEGKARPPASEEEIASAEADLGFGLPPLLRRIYAEVADGGWGPGHAVVPVRRGHAAPEGGACLVETRASLADGAEWLPPFVPFCEWGTPVWSCLDCQTDEGPVVTASGELEFTDIGHDLRSWLHAWLAGTDLYKEMFEPGHTRRTMNPFTNELIEVQVPPRPKGRPWP
jgi:hypothetical protein